MKIRGVVVFMCLVSLNTQETRANERRAKLRQERHICRKCPLRLSKLSQERHLPARFIGSLRTPVYTTARKEDDGTSPGNVPPAPGYRSAYEIDCTPTIAATPRM